MKWGWLLTAVALSAFLFVRRRKLGKLELGAGVLAVAGAVLVGTGVIDLPNIEKLIEDVGTRLGRWTYLLVGTARVPRDRRVRRASSRPARPRCWSAASSPARARSTCSC